MLSPCTMAFEAVPLGRVLVKLAVGASVLVLSLPVGLGIVAAGDDAGVREFLSSQPPVRREPTVAPSGPEFMPSPIRQRLVNVAPLPIRERTVRLPQRPRAVFAALPPLTERPKARPGTIVEAPTKMSKPGLGEVSKGVDPTAALMLDPTLRAGDIVVLADGPKVFKGGGRPPFRGRDFEEVSGSRTVSKKAQHQLLAMTGHALRPADELRRHVVVPQSSSAPDVPTEQQASSVRIVYPGFR